MSKESKYFWDLMKALGVGLLCAVAGLAVCCAFLYGLAWFVALTGG